MDAMTAIFLVRIAAIHWRLRLPTFQAHG